MTYDEFAKQLQEQFPLFGVKSGYIGTCSLTHDDRCFRIFTTVEIDGTWGRTRLSFTIADPQHVSPLEMLRVVNRLTKEATGEGIVSGVAANTIANSLRFNRLGLPL